jgi:hypothetical protein
MLLRANRQNTRQIVSNITFNKIKIQLHTKLKAKCLLMLDKKVLFPIASYFEILNYVLLVAPAHPPTRTGFSIFPRSPYV